MLFFSGTGLDKFYKINLKTERISVKDHLLLGTHNVQLYDHHLIYNNTANDVISSKNLLNGKNDNIEISKIEDNELVNSDIPKDHARNGFARGLCMQGDFIIGGSSPSTVSVYSFKDKKLIKSVNLTKDIRNAIHGLEIFPYTVNFNN